MGEQGRRGWRLPAAIIVAAMTAGCAVTAGVCSYCSAERVTPPDEGRNRIWIDFQDRTGTQLDLRDALIAGATSRGYEICNDYQTADYLLWATLRFFGETEMDNGNEQAAALDGVTTGAVTTYGLAGQGLQWPAGVAGVPTGIAAGSLAPLTTAKEYSMIVDMQIAERVEGREDQVQFETRIVGWAQGTDLSEEDARNTIVPRLEESMSKQLPRAS